MKARGWIIAVLAAILVAVISYAVSLSVCTRRSCGNLPGAGPGVIAAYLDLTPAQVKKVGPTYVKFLSEQQSTWVEMQEAKSELLAALKNPNPSRSEVDASLAKVNRVQAKLQSQAAYYLLEIKPHLTAEQNEKLIGLVEQRFRGQGRCATGFCPNGLGPGRHGRGFSGKQ